MCPVVLGQESDLLFFYDDDIDDNDHVYELDLVDEGNHVGSGVMMKLRMRSRLTTKICNFLRVTVGNPDFRDKSVVF